MKINGMDSRDILSGLVVNLYKKAINPSFEFPLAIRLIDTPDLAKAIFLAPDTFVKNYFFLESLSKGRFSANGEDWKRRAAITQPFYSQATTVLDEQALEAIYAKHIQLYLHSSQPKLSETFINAALEAVSRMFGLSNNIAWPAELVSRARAALVDQQAIAWLGSSPKLAEQSQRELRLIFAEFSSLWQADPELMQLLDQFNARAQGLADFSAAGELLQSLFAATETAASGMLWAIECMTRHATLPAIMHPELHPAEIGFFLDEVLRIFTPVPYVSRVCTKASVINGQAFAENEAIIISIVGVHSDPKHWHEPLLFKPKREEFVNASYARHAYIPFLSGPRACAGMKLARQEVKCGMQALLKVFAVQACVEPRGLDYGLASRPSVQLERYLTPRLEVSV